MQLLFNDKLENSLVQNEISWVHLCAQPAHGPSSCLYGEFNVEPIAMKRGSSENYHFLNLLPKVMKTSISLRHNGPGYYIFVQVCVWLIV